MVKRVNNLLKNIGERLTHGTSCWNTWLVLRAIGKVAIKASGMSPNRPVCLRSNFSVMTSWP
jgi:hypothetical protein